MSIDAAFSHFPALMTDRLLLRQLLPADAEALFAIKSDLEVTKHYGQEPHQSQAESLAWIQRRQDSFARRADIVWCLTLTGEDRLIGTCTLWNLDPGYHCGEVGYELHLVYGKQGIMREAVAAILTFGFSELGLHRIEATPFAENADSKNLLLKLGFRHEGTLRQRHYFRDRYLDQLYFGLLQEEWLKSA